MFSSLAPIVVDVLESRILARCLVLDKDAHILPPAS
jgi:hypothetical protein